MTLPPEVTLPKVQRASGVVVDVRALQAHDHASRGIGRYTYELISAIEQADPTLVRAFVADPRFPMHEQVLRLLPTGKLRRSDDPEFTEHPPRVFHVTSPFVEGVTQTPMLPVWARGHDTAVVATVYDLIPARFPEVYLGDAATARLYSARCEFLRTCDRLYAISEATSRDLQELLEISPQRVLTIHGAAAPQFSAQPEVALPAGGPAQHVGDHGGLGDTEGLTSAVLAKFVASSSDSVGYVLCPTGAEWRKNLDRLLQAWAVLGSDLRSAYPLLVQCHLQPDALEHLTARASELGIADSVVFTGAVSDAELIELLRGATLVVFPSLYEGLGLPILEAQACGAAVICGDNSSLRELVPDPSARFDAESVPDIARVLELFLADPVARQELAATAVAERYQWSEVGRLVSESYRELLEIPITPDVARPFRLALASPMPPQLCGPAGYFAEFINYLPDLCELTVFTTLDPAAVELPREVRVERLDALEVIEAIEGPFDEVLYFLGDSEFHIGELLQLQRRPGAVVLHDARLNILYTEMHRRYPHLMDENFGQSLHRMYPGRYPSALGGAQFLPLAEEGTYGILMVADVAKLATRLFVHSEHAADLIELDCGRRAEVLFPIPCPWLPSEETVGSLPRIAAGSRPLIASFGFASQAKRSELLVDVMQGLPLADLALVGHIGEHFREALRTAAQAQGTAGHVTVTGKVTSREYQEWLAKTTIAVQLRLFSNGESSASVAETLAAGIPTVVTDIGTFSEYPDDTVVKLPRNISSEELATVLSELLEDAPRLAALSAAGRAYAARNNYQLAAEKLSSVLVQSTVDSGNRPATC